MRYRLVNDLLDAEPQWRAYALRHWGFQWHEGCQVFWASPSFAYALEQFAKRQQRPWPEGLEVAR